MKIIVLAVLTGILAALMILAVSVPPKTLHHCDAAAAIAVAVTKAKGC